MFFLSYRAALPHLILVNKDSLETSVEHISYALNRL